MSASARLLARASAGDDRAFELLVRRRRPGLARYAERMVAGAGVDAEAIVQESLVAAHRAIDDARPEQFDAWLRRIVHRRSIDALRAHREHGPLDGADPAAATAPDLVPATAGRRARVREVLTDVQRLPEQQRAALLLTAVEGRSHQETADVLETSVAATKMLVARARAGLARQAEARTTDCPTIRDELALAHEERRRPAEHARLHLRTCAPCRTWRQGLRRVDRRLGLLAPGGLLGALAGIGLGSGGAQVAAGGAVAVVVGVGVVGATQTIDPGERTPVDVAGGLTFAGQRIERGSGLPPGVSVVRRDVRLDPARRRDGLLPLRFACPAGSLVEGLVPPSDFTGAGLAAFQTERAGLLGRYRAITTLYKADPELQRPRRARLGVVCKRR